MPFAPGHYKRVTESGTRGRRERWVLVTGSVVTLIVAAVTLFSLTSHDLKNGHGCLGFTYAMVMGGEQQHACGAKARRLCARPPQLGGLAHDFAVRLQAACRAADLPYKTSLPSSSTTSGS